ncbi:MAG: sulfite reductase [Acidobacteria bacterium]|nr:sulfite reductase [Acidobacteriota bacterium]
MTADTDPGPKPSKVEVIKAESDFLRGTILEGLADTSTGAIAADDTQLSKFHGVYQQDDRDLRKDRVKQKLEKAFIFLCRIAVPGGVVTPEQWQLIDRIADDTANSTIKITTRQAFQFHGVIKGDLKRTIREINESLLTTLSACGDVNRNVMAAANPHESVLHEQTSDIANAISSHLKPRTRAYHEIWLDGEKVAGVEDEEPIYGKTYLPRKFKIALAVPPRNDVDVFSNDLGFIAIEENGELMGFDVAVGGGLGMTHGKPKTYPRLADVIGFCRPDQVVAVAESAVLIQRDHGDRSDRRHARFKYTIDDRGIDWFKDELHKLLGWNLESARGFHFDSMTDPFGWVTGRDGLSYYTLLVEGGRVRDHNGRNLKSALREIAAEHEGDFRLTANQNLVIGRIPEEAKSRISQILSAHGVGDAHEGSGLRLNSIACTAMPTCGLALAEAERYLPDLVTDLEAVIEECGLWSDEIVIRMTGCPNGCGRPYLGEIGLVGKVPGKYNLYLGAGFDGGRLNKLYKEALTHEEIITELKPLFLRYAKEREDDERFGDFCIRTGYVKATRQGMDFHD